MGVEDGSYAVGSADDRSESVDLLHMQKALDKMNLRLIAWSELKILMRSLPLSLQALPT
jgi:hypothetical protein